MKELLTVLHDQSPRSSRGKFGPSNISSSSSRSYSSKDFHQKHVDASKADGYQSYNHQDNINVDFSLDHYFLTDEELNEEVEQMEVLFNNMQSSGVTTTCLVPIVKPIATYDKEFNDMEVLRLSELLTAANEFEEAKYPKTKIFIEVNTMADMHKVFASLDLMDRALHSSIKFCRSMSLFNEMCDDDKVTLLKNNVWKILCLRSLLSHDPLKLFWTYPIVRNLTL